MAAIGWRDQYMSVPAIIKPRSTHEMLLDSVSWRMAATSVHPNSCTLVLAQTPGECIVVVHPEFTRAEDIAKRLVQLFCNGRTTAQAQSVYVDPCTDTIVNAKTFGTFKELEEFLAATDLKIIGEG